MPNSQLRDPEERLDKTNGQTTTVIHPAAIEEIGRFADENKSRSETAKNLEDSENSAKAPAKGSISDQEEDGNPVDKPGWITNISEKRKGMEKDRDKKLSRAKAYLRIAKRKGPLSAIILTLVGGGIGITGLMSPGLLIIQIKEVMVNKFNTQLTSMDVRTKKIISAKMTKGSCNLVPIACKYELMSKKQVARFKEAGIKISYEETARANRVKPTDIEFEGKPISPSDFYKKLNTDAKFRLAVKKAYNPLFASFYDKVWDRTLFYIDKNGVHLGDNTDAAKLKEVQSITKDAVDESRQGVDVDSKNGTDKDGNPNDSSKQQANELVDELGDSADPGTKAATEVADNAADIAKGIGSSVDNFMGETLGMLAKTGINSLKLTGAIDNACMLYGSTRALGVAAKTVRAVQLIAFASIFLKIADQIMAGGNPDQGDVEYIGKVLTTESTTINSDGSKSVGSATDSFGYKYAAYGQLGRMPDSASQFMVGAGLAGSLTTVTSYINLMLGKSPNTICKISQNILFQIGSLVVSGIVAYFSGGTSIKIGQVAQAAGWAAVAIAITLIPAMLKDIVAGKLVDKSTVGMLSLEAMTPGSSAMMGKLAAGGGNSIMSKPQAVMYKKLSTEVAKEYAEEDQIAYSPLDITNTNTFLGKFALNIAPYIYNMSSLPSAIGSITSLTTGSLAHINNQQTYALSAEEYGMCKDLDYINLELAADPYCNLVYGIPTEYLDTDPVEIANYLALKGDIDSETGEVIPKYTPPLLVPKGTTIKSYDEFLQRCINRSDPIGFTGQDFQGSDGSECMSSASQDMKYYYLYTIDQRVEDGMSGDDQSLNMAYEMGLDKSPNIAFYDGSNGLNSNNIASESIFSKIANFFNNLFNNKQTVKL